MATYLDANNPKFMYHATKPPVQVFSQQEQAALGPEWSEKYIHQEYPKWKYHWTGKTAIVKNSVQEADLGGGWADTPNAFAPYTGPRQTRTDRQDPVKWVDTWSVPGLSTTHRNQIKAALWTADAAFARSSEADSADLASMKHAFSGIAKVLFDAAILTEQYLRIEIPSLVWDSAIAGGWFRFASETRQSIFAEQLGHYWVWRDESRDWQILFRAETAEWRARLLEVPAPRAATPNPVDVVREPQEGHQPTLVGTDLTAFHETAPDEGINFASEAGRNSAVTAYAKHWNCSEASLARTATVDPADLVKWKKGELPRTSDKKARIEKALKDNGPPTPPARREFGS